MSDHAGLKVETVGGVATVTFDHPPVNLFTLELFLATADAVERLAADDDVRVVVLRSANPDFFLAHFVVEAILRMPTDLPRSDRLGRFHVMCEPLRTMAKPTIAVTEGRVGGGTTASPALAYSRRGQEADREGAAFRGGGCLG